MNLIFAATCINLASGVEPTIKNVCSGLREDQETITLFSDHYVPVDCRFSLEGMWHFAYQVRNQQISQWYSKKRKKKKAWQSGFHIMASSLVSQSSFFKEVCYSILVPTQKKLRGYINFWKVNVTIKKINLHLSKI